MKKCRKLLVLLLSIALLVGTAAVGAGALTNEKHWVGSWSAGMTDISVSLLEGKKNTEGLSISPFVKNMTARIRLTPTLGGNKVRFCLSNENGSSPLVIDQASIARAKGDSGAEIVSGSSIPVTFNGSRKVAIPAGGTIYCDPVDMEVRALEDLCVTYYAQDFGMVQTMALYGATTYLAFGNHTRRSEAHRNQAIVRHIGFCRSAAQRIGCLRGCGRLFHRCHRRFNHEQRYSKTACQADHGRDW